MLVINNVIKKGAKLNGCSLNGTTLSSADLSYSDLSNSSFANCRMDGINLSYITFNEYFDLTGSMLENSIWTNDKYQFEINDFFASKNISYEHLDGSDWRITWMDGKIYQVNAMTKIFSIVQ